jgi:serine/threonine-protein kinase
LDELTVTMGTAADSSPVLLPLPLGIGAVVADRYELLELLGRGGMGAVFGAHDRVLDEQVALKVLFGEVMEGAAERFRREVKLARRVTDPNVARTFEAGFSGGHPFITMEYVDGETLKARLARVRRVDAEEALSILAGVGKGLAAAHRAGVVHRDVKPGNVLIARNGRVVITDFGIAETAHAQVDGSSGTPQYMAPEQVEGREVTPRSDVFSFGVTAFECLIGRRPFLARSKDQLLRDHRDGAPDLLSLDASLPRALAELVNRCLLLDPRLRFPSAEPIAELLDRMEEDDLARKRRVLARRWRDAGHRPAVAVLPFENELDPDRELLVEGLAVDLMEILSTCSSVRILSRQAVLEDPHRARLSVRGVVRAGSTPGLARVALSIHDSDGENQQLPELELRPELGLSLTDEVWTALADALAISVHQSCPAPRDTDPRAIELYLKARRLYQRVDKPGTEEALMLLERALAIAPDDANISAGYALACVRSWFLHGGGDEKQARAMEAAKRALRKAVDRGEPHLALGVVLLQSGNAADAARSLTHAISRSPSLAEAHEWLGRLLIEADQVTAGVKRLDAAQELDPTSRLHQWDRLRLAALMGDWDTYEELLARRSPDAVRETHFSVSPIRHALWHPAPTFLERMIAQHPAQELPKDRPASLYTQDVLAVFGSPDPLPAFELGAREADNPSYSPRRRAHARQLECELALYLGFRERAVAALQAAIRHGLSDVFWLRRCPLLDPIRALPAFAAASLELTRRADAVGDALWS